MRVCVYIHTYTHTCIHIYIICVVTKRRIFSSVIQERSSSKTEIKLAFSFEFVTLPVGR